MIDKKYRVISFIKDNKIIEFNLTSIYLFPKMEEFLKLLSYVDLDTSNKEENILYIYDFFIKTELPKFANYFNDNYKNREENIRVLLDYKKEIFETLNHLKATQEILLNTNKEIQQIDNEYEKETYNSYTDGVFNSVSFLFSREETTKEVELLKEKEVLINKTKELQTEITNIKKKLKRQERRYYKLSDKVIDVNLDIYLDNQRFEFIKEVEKILKDKYNVS